MKVGTVVRGLPTGDSVLSSVELVSGTGTSGTRDEIVGEGEVHLPFQDGDVFTIRTKKVDPKIDNNRTFPVESRASNRENTDKLMYWDGGKKHAIANRQNK